MNISPLDFRQASFGSALRGFNRDEVASFLNEAAADYERVLRDTDRLQQEVGTLQKELDEHRRREATLRDTLLTAQRVSVEVRESAKQEAQLIVREAHTRADELTRTANAQRQDVEREIADLRRKRTDVEASIEGSIVALRHALEAVKRQDRDRLQDDKARQQHPRSDAKRNGSGRPAPSPVIAIAESRPLA
jgi:cell division initiation protein